MKVIFIAISFVAVFLNAAISFSSPTDSLRDIHVESYPAKFYIKPLFNVRNLSLDLVSRISDHELNFRPNGNAYFGIGIFAFDLGFETSFRLPQNSRDKFRYGQTEFFDLQTSIYAKKWGADFSIQQYDGFYVSNPMPHYPSWKRSQAYPLRPDLVINSFSANIFYLANNQKFSYRSAYNQADRQKHSGGSFIVGVNYLNQEVTADTSLIPYASRNEFMLDNFRYAGFSSLGVLPGYTHTFVLNYFYLNISASLGPALLYSIYNENDETLRRDQVAPVALIRMALGYNSPKWFAGFTVVNHTSNMATDRLDINRESGNVKFFIGYRFREFGFLKKNIF